MTLSSYLFSAITLWMGATAEAVIERSSVVASDIAEVVSDAAEPAIWQQGVVMNGLVLASLAVMEGGMNEYVDSGKCNDPVWRKAHASMLSAGDCDGGRAYSLWQIHPGSGLLLLPSAGYISVQHSKGVQGERVTAGQLLTDRKLAVRTALHMLRQSVSKTGGMCGYTGESGECPKAKVRLDRAKKFFSEHPYERD